MPEEEVVVLTSSPYARGDPIVSETVVIWRLSKGIEKVALGHYRRNKFRAGRRSAPELAKTRTPEPMLRTLALTPLSLLACKGTRERGWD